MEPLHWAFFSYAHNYGDCSRAVELAREMKSIGARVNFFERGGRYVEQIEQAGLEPIALEPKISDEQDEVLLAIDQHRAPIGTPLPFSEQQLTAMVESELAAFERYRPDAVYCGLNLSSLISVPFARLPMITCIPTALCPAFFRKGLATFPNAMETNFFIRYLLPGRLKDFLLNRIMLGDVARKTAEVFNRVRRRFGLAPVYNFPSLVRGDLTLLPDLPELSGLAEKDLPEGYRYTGPLFARLQMPLPEGALAVFERQGPKIYCSLGSSAPPELLHRVVGFLREERRYNLVCATTKIMDPAGLGAAEDDFYATSFLPAHQVNPLADVAVTHGGQGTVQNAVWSGTPVVGTGMQWEQQANLDGLARAGMAIRIPLHSVSRKRLLQAVERVREPAYRRNASRLQQLVRSVDGAREAVRAMNRFVRP